MNKVVIVETRVVLEECCEECPHFLETKWGTCCKKKDKWIAGTDFPKWCPLEETNEK